MALIHAKCTECGATLEIDKEKDAAICPYCGAAFVTEKAINNYNTYVTNNIVIDGENADELLSAVQGENLDTLKDKFDTLMSQENYEYAEKTAREIIEKYPESAVGYACLIKSYPEYRQYGMDDYNYYIQNRVLYYEDHPFRVLLSKLKKCATNNLSAYSEITEKCEKVLADFQTAVLNKIISLKKKAKKAALQLFSCSLVALIFCIVMDIVLVEKVFSLIMLWSIGGYFSLSFFCLGFVIPRYILRSANELKLIAKNSGTTDGCENDKTK